MQQGWLIENLAQLSTSPVTKRTGQKQVRGNTKRSIKSMIRINRTSATCNVQFKGALQNARNFHYAGRNNQDLPPDCSAQISGSDDTPTTVPQERPSGLCQ